MDIHIHPKIDAGGSNKSPALTEAAKSERRTGRKKHHADRGQLHYPQNPGNTALSEGEPEVQGHLSAGLLAMGESCGLAMAGTSRHNNTQPSVPLNAANVEKSSKFYGNRQPFPGVRQRPDCIRSAIRHKFLSLRLTLNTLVHCCDQSYESTRMSVYLIEPALFAVRVLMNPMINSLSEM